MFKKSGHAGWPSVSRDRFGDSVHDFLKTFIRNHQIELELWNQIDGVLLAAIYIRMALLPAMPANLTDGHAIDTDARQSFPDFFELERLDDGLNFFHLDAAKIR
jgi:hypothetical protein